MDTKFQTSFIPKKTSLTETKIVKHNHGTSFFTFISVMIFIVSVVGAVFSVVWKNVLIKSQENYKVELKKAEEKFNTALIDELREANAKIDLSKTILKNHIAASEVFSIISGLTIQGVKFNSFEFSGSPTSNDGIDISLKGIGNSFSAIAFQSDVFGQSTQFGTNKPLKNPVVTDLALDDKGNVGFTFSATLDPADLSYEKILNEELNQ